MNDDPAQTHPLNYATPTRYNRSPGALLGGFATGLFALLFLLYGFGGFFWLFSSKDRPTDWYDVLMVGALFALAAIAVWATVRLFRFGLWGRKPTAGG